MERDRCDPASAKNANKQANNGGSEGRLCRNISREMTYVADIKLGVLALITVSWVVGFYCGNIMMLRDVRLAKVCLRERYRCQRSCTLGCGKSTCPTRVCRD